MRERGRGDDKGDAQRRLEQAVFGPLLVLAQLEAVVARKDDNGLGAARLHLREQSPHHLIDEGYRREVGTPQCACAVGGHPIGVRLGRRLAIAPLAKVGVAIAQLA